jgi:S-adenosylmethionine uptake transporter
LHPGHLAAAGVALGAAATVITLRALGPTEKRITLMGVVLLVSLAGNGAAMLFDFHPPALRDLEWLAFAGLLAGFGHILLMAATRAAPANRIAPGQYSQMVWALLLGALFFEEFPDATALAGIGLIVFAGLFTFLREEKRGGRWPAVWTIVWGRGNGSSPASRGRGWGGRKDKRRYT